MKYIIHLHILYIEATANENDVINKCFKDYNKLRLHLCVINGLHYVLYDSLDICIFQFHGSHYLFYI